MSRDADGNWDGWVEVPPRDASEGVDEEHQDTAYGSRGPCGTASNHVAADSECKNVGADGLGDEGSFFFLFQHHLVTVHFTLPTTVDQGSSPRDARGGTTLRMGDARPTWSGCTPSSRAKTATSMLVGSIYTLVIKYLFKAMLNSLVDYPFWFLSSQFPPKFPSKTLPMSSPNSRKHPKNDPCQFPEKVAE